MRSRRLPVLSVIAAGLLLAGCASADTGTATPTETGAPGSPTADVVEASFDSPATAGQRVGADGLALEVWSSTVPDPAAASALGDPSADTQWVTVTVAQWVAAEGLQDVDVAPVLRSVPDVAFEASGVSPRTIEVPMTPEKSYTFAWSFQVPENLIDAETLVLCTTAEADAGCSSIAFD